MQVLYSYTVEDALMDGMYIELTDEHTNGEGPMADNEDASLFAHNQKQLGFMMTYPTIVTPGVMSMVERAANNEKHLNDRRGILHDLSWMGFLAARRLFVQRTRDGEEVFLGEEVPFTVTITGDGPQNNKTIILSTVRKSTGEICWLFYLPEED